MRIHISSFCNLATSPKFLGWLRDFDGDIWRRLTDGVRASTSCNDNTRIMTSALNEIVAKVDGERRLMSFLSVAFPHVLKLPNRGVDPVFGQFDPSILTLPRRAIFDDEASAAKVINEAAVVEHLFYDGRHYVEYLPIGMAPFHGNIPDRNWKIREWRRTH